jgi:hypothetical protein
MQQIAERPSPRITIQKLLALNPADSAVVSDFLGSLANPRSEHRLEIPEPSAMAVLGPDYYSLLDREDHTPGYLAAPHFAALLMEIDGQIRLGIDRALDATSGIPHEWRDFQRDYAGVEAAISPTNSIRSESRRLESRLLIMAQLELGRLWKRINRSDWSPDDLSKARHVLFDDVDLMLRRSRPFLAFSANSSADDEGIQRAVWIKSSWYTFGGLADCYYQTLAYYTKAYERILPQPGLRCLYCKKPMPPERKWRADIRTCGDAACKKQYEADRHWYRDNENDVRPVVVQHLGLSNGANLHPGVARNEWARLGYSCDRRRGSGRPRADGKSLTP